MNARKSFLALAMLTMLAIVTGCQNAVRTIAVSADSVDAFVLADDQDRAGMKANFPQIHEAAEKLRREFPAQCTLALDAVLAYARDGSTENGDKLKASLAAVRESARLARLYLAQLSASQKT